MYKLFIVPPSTEANSIIRLSDNVSIPVDSGNSDYLRFVNDIYINGIGIVEGADYVGVTTYTKARKAEYPPIEDQLDKIYHSGVNAWKADIKKIKDKYPKTQVGITSIAPIPDWVNTALFNKQKEEYVKATARLARYELANGVFAADGISYEVAPLAIYIDGIGRNPLIIQDEMEREAAQEVINNTPQAVIDSVSS
jgi:hypothetical protein